MIPKNQIHPEWRSHPSHLQKPRVQVILPVHDEQANLPVLYQRLHQTLADCSSDWNLIFVDDGSRDGGPQWLSDFASTDPRVTVITLV